MKRELIFTLAVIILVSFAYAIQYNLPDGVDNVVEGVSGGGGGSGSSPSLDIDPNSSDLIMMGMISCYDDDRGFDGEDPRTVIFDMKEFYDGILDGASYQIKYAEPFLSSGWDPEATKVTLPPFDPNNPVHIRFEGRDFGPDSMSGCYFFGNAWHQEYEDGVLKGSAYNTGWQRAPNNVFQQHVDWDKSQSNCEVLGGAWLSGGNYDGYRCCGDDWIWVNNIAINYQPLSIVDQTARFSDDSLCLYSSYPDYGKGIDISDYFGTNSYICDPRNLGHSSYDTSLGYDDGYRDSQISSSPYYFIYDGSQKTDLGKWSDHSGTNAQVCTVGFDNSPGKGVVFSWQDISTAADSGQAMCELYLGYNWTGTKCCGAPGSPDTYNDPAKECDSQTQADDIESQTGIGLSDVAFMSEFDALCSSPSRLSKNRACYDKYSVDNHQILSSDREQPEIEDLFNLDGMLHFCQSSVVSPPAGFDADPKCSLLGVKGDFAVCTYGNDSWKTQNNAGETLGYIGNKFADLNAEKSKLHESSLPNEISSSMGIGQQTECCFADSCWDGSACQPNSTYYWFKPSEQYWGEKISGEDWNGQIKVYRCKNGEWNGPLEPVYDWDQNTDKPEFCVEDYQCACTDKNCPGHTSNGCTNVPNYFTGDHFCDNENWTSRTRILAEQLMEIAGSDDYELFCDKFENSVNYYKPLEQNKALINSVCVLKYSASDNVVLGFSLNTGFDAKNTDIQDELLNFISSTFEEDLSECDNAVNPTDNSQYGNFRRCKTNNNAYWFNKNSRLLIYAKGGLLATDPMPSDYQANGDMIESLFNWISSEIYTAGPDINIRSITAFANARDFSRMYLASENGDRVLGVIENVYDDYYEDNRNFLGVAYTGISGVDCTKIRAADKNAYCDDSGQEVIVLEKNTNDDFPYWTDLTAKLRFAG